MKHYAIENRKMRVEIGKANGVIQSIFLKHGRQEYMFGEGQTHIAVEDLLEHRRWVNTETGAGRIGVMGRTKERMIFRKNYKNASFVCEEHICLEPEALRLDVYMDPVKGANERSLTVSFTFPHPAVKDLDGWNTDWKIWAPAQDMPGSLGYNGHRFFAYNSVLLQGTTRIFIPIMSVYNESLNLGLSFIKPIETEIPGTVFECQDTMEGPLIRISHHFLRLAGGKRARASLLIIPHQGDWRDGLGKFYRRYRDYFEPRDKRILQIESSVLPYSIGFATRKELVYAQKTVPEKKGIILPRLITRQGILAPPEEFLANKPIGKISGQEQENFIREILACKMENGGDKLLALPGFLLRYRQVYPELVKRTNRYISEIHNHGFHAFMYFCAIETIQEYARKYFPECIARRDDGQGVKAFGRCYWMAFDEHHRRWKDYILKQLTVRLESFPELDGIFFDNVGLEYLSVAHDDGITTLGNHRAWTHFSRAVDTFYEELTDLVRSSGKLTMGNTPRSVSRATFFDYLLLENSCAYHAGRQGIANDCKFRRFPDHRQFDGAFLALTKPVYAAMTVSPEQYTELLYRNMLNLCLKFGVLMPFRGFFTALKGAKAKSWEAKTTPAEILKLSLRYHHLQCYLINRRWVFFPHALTLPVDMDGNIFQVGDNYVVTVFPLQNYQKDGCFSELIVQIPNMTAFKKIEFITTRGAGKIDYQRDAGKIIFQIPYNIEAAILRIAKEKHDKSATARSAKA